MKTAIAIALYNGERFLKEQLDCLRLQTKPADEVVLCDDGSKDNTCAMVEEYIRSHGLEESWKLYRNERNLGYVKNFYYAVSLCDADLVFLCDQDDIWAEDKLEKMTAVMEQRPEISLLTCQYGIIDAEGNRQRSIVESDEKTDEAVQIVTVTDIMRAFRWPGMIMCVRKTFFEEIRGQIESCPAAHDIVLCLCAAERNSFFDYHYVGAYHRRHGNNTAREEHRVSKLLNRELKLREIGIVIRQWQDLLDSGIRFSRETREAIIRRQELLCKRLAALENRSLFGILRLYTKENGGYLRLKSFVCDLWLVCISR